MSEVQKKAKEFINKFSTKQDAIIAVQEIINANPHSNPMTTGVFSTMGHWQQVKEEIENFKH